MSAPHLEGGGWPSCRVGEATDYPCRLPATVDAFRNGVPTMCQPHYREHELRADLEELEDAHFWLDSWERQAEHLSIGALKDAMRFVRTEADLEIARLKSEIVQVWEETAEEEAG